MGGPYIEPTTAVLALKALGQLEESAQEVLGRPISEERLNRIREEIARFDQRPSENLPKENTPAELIMGLALELVLYGKPYVLQPNFQIGNYKVDYLLSAKGWPWPVVIECDGLQHENQKEYDDKRDTYLAELGYTVRRFPNKRIYREPLECAKEAASLIPWGIL